MWKYVHMTSQSNKVNLLGRCAHSLNIFKGLTKFFLLIRKKRTELSAILISFRSADLLRICLLFASCFCDISARIILFPHFYIESSHDIITRYYKLDCRVIYNMKFIKIMHYLLNHISASVTNRLIQATMLSS